MKSALEIGQAIFALCRQEKNLAAIDQFCSPTIESVEALAMPPMGKVQRGIEAVKGKNKWWVGNNQVHSAEMQGPFPNGDQFIIHFK